MQPSINTINSYLLVGKSEAAAGRERGLCANRPTLLDLVALLERRHVSGESVYAAIGQDVTLSYKLLRMINHSYFGMTRRTDSLRRAIAFYGLNRLKNWSAVLVANSVPFEPQELLEKSRRRALACERIAREAGETNLEPFYLTGLFSLLDGVAGAPMDVALSKLCLSQEIDKALLHGTGKLGEALRAAKVLEDAVPAEPEKFSEGRRLARAV